MIVLVRHGETDANARGLALGRADPPLTGRGLVQAQRLAARFATPAGATGATGGSAIGMNPAAVVRTSPLQRARQTADAIAGALGLGVVVDDRLVEMDYGEWDGLSFSEIPADALARWHADPSLVPPGGESLDAVGARMADFCEELITGSVIAVSHVSPIKAAVVWALGTGQELAWRMFLDLASVTRIAQRAGAASLVGYNDTSHLAPE